MDNPTSASRKNLSDYLAWLLPSYSMMNYPYSANWDKKLRQLLEAHTFVLESQYIAKLGDFKVWVENHPYASFQPRMQGLPEHVRPSRSTIHYAMRRLCEDWGITRDPFPSPPPSGPQYTRHLGNCSYWSTNVCDCTDAKGFTREVAPLSARPAEQYCECADLNLSELGKQVRRVAAQGQWDWMRCERCNKHIRPEPAAPSSTEGEEKNES